MSVERNVSPLIKAKDMLSSSNGANGITTTLTNPGIIDRLEQDIADYLSPFGFRLERTGRRAVLAIPHISHNSCTSMVDCEDDTSNNGALVASATTPTATRNNEHNVGPLFTLHLHIHQESLLATVGPLLRTFLRLTPNNISPQRLRSVIHCEFTLDALGKFDKMNSEQKHNQLNRQEELSARRMAHHVHMMVRNSMGSALCLELIVVLPCYWRRKMEEDNDIDSTTTTMRSKVPISVDSVVLAMKSNPDACYPSVQLVEQSENGLNSGDTFTIHLDVRTRMCTVRHQPLLFRWISSLQCRTATGDADIQCKERVNSTNGQQMHPAPFDRGKIPLIVACIEKVANLHRILMLCHDYDKMNCNKKGNDCCVQKENGFEQSSESSFLSNVVVILPNVDEEQRDKALREFDDAIDHFHKVIDKEGDWGFGSSEKYRPTLIYEEHAAEQISIMIEQCSSPPYDTSQTFQSSIVGVDLHPDALTLHGNYATTTSNQNVSPALQKMRCADAIVFGYEKFGIPETFANGLNGWVQIPSRSSINVVAAMSIVLDALMGAGAGVLSN